jgi:hypothetical protein
MSGEQERTAGRCRQSKKRAPIHWISKKEGAFARQAVQSS